MSSDAIVADVGSNRVSEELVLALVAAQVRIGGDRPAVVDGPTRLSYQELDARANRLARWLGGRGAGPGTVIGIHCDRSWRLVVAALAVLRAGAAYLPIDPANPPARTAGMLADAGARLVLCATEHLPRLASDQEGGVAPVPLDRLDLTGLPASSPGVVVAPDELAYVVYTSGSTGAPKGVMVSHRALAHLVSAVGAGYDLGPTDRAGLVCSPSFDVSVSEVWLPLAAGASIHVPDAEALRSPEATIRWLTEQRVTITVLPTPLAERALQAPWPEQLDLHTLLTGGDRLHVRPAASLPFRLINNYGPTENTVISTFAVVPPCSTDGSLPSIGRPVPGTVVELLDAQLQPATEGEIYLGGPQVARGYLGQPALTAARFVPHPRPRVPGERLYRTGDLGRWLPTGEIEFLGRTDDQVQVRGHRIELGEVTAALTDHPDITAAHVTVHGHGETAQLVGYLQPADLRRLPAASALRAHLAERLPGYMLPAAFVTVESLPLGTNGKVDRAALPPLPRHGFDGAESAPPRTATEQVVVRLWAEVLGAERVGVTDRFLDLGGHSLLATRIIGRLNRHFGTDLPVGQLFETDTVAGLAAAVDAARATPTAGLPPVRPGSGALVGPLSMPQQQVWFLDQLVPGNAAYHAQATIRVTGPFDPDLFARALTALTKRHEILRTTYEEREGQPVAVVAPTGVVDPLRRLDLSPTPADQREQRLTEAVRAELARPFDLGQLPLQRWTAIRLGEQEHELVMVEHHLVHDGWSFAVMMRELEALYTGYARGEPPDLPPPAVQFRDYVLWQQELLGGPELKRQLAYWREQLAGASVLNLPTDHPRPAVQGHRGRVLRWELPAGLAAALASRCRAEGVSTYMLMYAAFVALLHRYTSDTDICVASGYANRRRPETEDLIGMLVNMVVLRAHLTGATPFRDLLTQARQRVLAAAAHQECPFPLVARELSGSRDLSRNPLAQVMFSAHDSAVRHPQFGEATGTVFERSNDTAKVDLNVVVVPRSHRELGRREHLDERITLLWEYNQELFEPETMQAMAQAYLRLLAAAVAAPETPVGRLPVLDDRATRTALVEWNPAATGAVPRSAPLVAELVAERARRSPQALAVACGDRRLSYQELMAQAGALAGRLVGAGIGPESVVAVCLPRSAELVVAELAVLTAGAAFLPIDPANPDQRIHSLLTESRVGLVVGSPAARPRLSLTGLPVLPFDLAAPVGPSSREPLAAPARPGPDELAYVMYTSGSTGAPKGVMVTQHGFTNLVAWHRERLRLGPEDRTTAVATCGFDFSVWEIWASLTAGASLHLPAAATLLSPAETQQWLLHQQITVASLPTPLAAALLQEPWPAGGPLRALGSGGDRLTVRPAAEFDFEVLNLYGPTENTVVSTSGTVAPVGQAGGAELPDIGTPIPGTTAYILDGELKPVPAGVVGELYLGGVGLARGYLGRPDLTADRFVPDPYGDPGSRLYRTGDLARHRRDGAIEFLGRIDDQVKVRGHRLEPAEVTAALRDHPGLRDAFVTVRTDRGEAELVGYLVPVAGEPAPDHGELRGYLAQRLPAPMLPADYVVLDALPLTRNGKVDRRALPPPNRSDPGAGTPAGDDLERRLVTIWAEVLRRDRVGVTDSFFDLGGHSLLLGQVQRRLEREWGRVVPLVALFAHPTIRSLAGYLADGEAVSADLPAAGGQPHGERLRSGRDRLRQRRGQRAGIE